MAPAAFVAPSVTSDSVFKPDIFKGKVLFCTGGGSGICRGMTEAMVLPFLSFPTVAVLMTPTDATRSQCYHCGAQVRKMLVADVFRMVLTQDARWQN